MIYHHCTIVEIDQHIYLLLFYFYFIFSACITPRDRFGVLHATNDNSKYENVLDWIAASYFFLYNSSL